MVPGFEDQLVGAMPGETREVAVTFPEGYGRPEISGKDAVFTVTVNEVKAPVPFTIDEDWAKELGFEDLAELKDTFAKRFTDEYKSMSRARLKRALLDRLAADYAFAVPRGHGRPRVRGDLEAAHRRDGAHRRQARRGRQERGRAQGRVPRRSPSGGCGWA